MCDTTFDFIGKLETLEDDFRFLLVKFPDLLAPFEKDLKVKLNTGGDTEGNLNRLFQQLSLNQIANLKRLYKIDFEMFEYDNAIV